jgi:hypothetical protein
LDVSSVPLSLTIVLHVAVDEAQGAAPSDLSCFGGEAIAFVALEAVISVIGVDLDRRLLRLDRLDVALPEMGTTLNLASPREFEPVLPP